MADYQTEWECHMEKQGARMKIARRIVWWVGLCGLVLIATLRILPKGQEIEPVPEYTRVVQGTDDTILIFSAGDTEDAIQITSSDGSIDICGDTAGDSLVITWEDAEINFGAGEPSGPWCPRCGHKEGHAQDCRESKELEERNNG